MSTITVTAQQDVQAPADEVFGLLGDYRNGRPRYLPDAITDYEVLSGDGGDGTLISYRLHATKKRIRQTEAEIHVPPGSRELVERTKEAQMRVTWRVTPIGDSTRVDVTLSWTGATGIGGLAERTFAPIGMRKIYGQMLERLAALAARER
jgi:hypothetical protein